jgi:hypothetical protein
VLGDEREAESGSAVTRRLRVLKWEKGKWRNIWYFACLREYSFLIENILK